MVDHGPAVEAVESSSLADESNSGPADATGVGQTASAGISPNRDACDAAATPTAQPVCENENNASMHPLNSSVSGMQPSAAAAAPEDGANGILGSAPSSSVGHDSPQQQHSSKSATRDTERVVPQTAADKQEGSSTSAAPVASDLPQQHTTTCNSSPKQQDGDTQQQQHQQTRHDKARTGDKRSLEDRSLFSPTKSPPSAAAATADQAGDQLDNNQEAATAAKSLKRRRASTSPPAAAAAGEEGPEQQQQAPQQQQQQHEGSHHRQHSADHSHIRRHHAIDEDGDQLEPPPAAAAAGSGDQQAQGQQQQQRHAQPKRKKVKGLLSFGDDDSPLDGGSSSDSDQQQYGSLSAATASRFRQEAKRAAAAARFTFKPSSGGGGSAAAGRGAAAAGGGGLVDDDGDLRAGNAGGGAAAAAGLSQIHFGFAAARGHRPYMEDRHTIITTLNPSAAAAAAALAAEDISAAAAAAVAVNGSGDGAAAAAAAAVHDGVGRSYAAIFDGHNGAGAAETAARKLHLLLASHPALRIYRGETGPPAVIKQEEVAVAAALKAAFRQVDDMVLGTARREGTRDGATALVVLRLGHALYAAHAGDSRAVLCRDAAAYRLTEDHKPHLPHERSRIEEAGGRVDFQRCWRVVVEPRDGRPGSGLAVSRSLGDLDFKEPHRFVECDPDVKRLLLQPKRDTFIVLASDGLWDVLSDTDAVITTATALKAYAAEHNSSNSVQPANPPGVAAMHTGSSSSTGNRIRPRPFNLGAAKAAGATAEVPDDIVYNDAAATAAAEALLSESMRRGTMDNVTVIVMLLQWG